MTNRELLRNTGNIFVALILSPYARRIVWLSIKRRFSIGDVVLACVIIVWGSASLFISGPKEPQSVYDNTRLCCIDNKETPSPPKPAECSDKCPTIDMQHLSVWTSQKSSNPDLIKNGYEYEMTSHDFVEQDMLETHQRPKLRKIVNDHEYDFIETYHKLPKPACDTGQKAGYTVLCYNE